MNKHENVDRQEVLDFAVKVGEILLKNGGEIFRVEETIRHICNHYELDDVNVYVLNNGIFATASHDGKYLSEKLRCVPVSVSHLGIVDAANDLSRKICSGQVSFEEAVDIFSDIQKIPSKRLCFTILASGVVSGMFCYLFGGNIIDSIVAFIVGMILQLAIVFFNTNHLSKLIVNTAGGGTIALLSVLSCYLFPDFHLGFHNIVTGCLMPLVPGVAIVNAIRDISNNDIISGIVRMIDALLVFVYIAIGVAVVLAVFSFSV